MLENAYLSIKNPKASRVLNWALDPRTDSLFHFCDSALLLQQLLASEAGAP